MKLSKNDQNINDIINYQRFKTLKLRENVNSPKLK